MISPGRLESRIVSFSQISLARLLHHMNLTERRPESVEDDRFPNALHTVSFLSRVNQDFYRLIEDHSCYEDLGTIEDMSSSSIIEAYHQQVSVNPTRAPHYLQCLKTIADLRGGSDREEIEQAVMLAYSEGRYTPEDVFHAYKYFGLDPHDPHLTEETIIAKFYVFLGSTTQETETRTQLWRIGDWKRNERIKSAAEDRTFLCRGIHALTILSTNFRFKGVSTVEQACVFLGVEENTADDFVMTMYTAKVRKRSFYQVIWFLYDMILS